VSEGVASTCNFPFSHSLCGGTFPRLGPPIRAFLMRHDLLCSIGADLFTLSLPSDVEPMPHGLDVIHIDVDPWEIGKNYAATVGIQGDPKATLPELCEAVRRHSTKTGHPQAAKRRERVALDNAGERAELELKAQLGASQSPMPALALVHAVAQATPAGATIVDETISSAAGVRTFYRCEDAKSFFGLRGGGIGWGLPAAIGVKLALPQRPVVALIGDGSAMYTCQGLWTAAHESVPVVFVIFNNASYRILKQRTLALKGFSAEDDHYVGMDLDRPLIDHVGLAKSFGVPGERVEKVAEVGPAMGRALASGGPYLIDARIDPHFK
jgi:benzoylformate decarboxylase